MYVNINPFVLRDYVSNESRKNCVVISQSEDPWSYEVKCDYREVLRRKINAADALAIRQYTAGEVLLYTLYLSYSLEGMEKLSSIDPENELSNVERQIEIENIKTLGTLRKDNSFHLVAELGTDFASAVKWVVQNQKELCPTGSVNEKNRPGMVFNSGFCVKNTRKNKSDLALLELALKGPIQQVLYNTKENVKESTLVDPMAFFRNPPQDLRSMAPSKWNHCDKAISLRDATFGGVFPAANAESFVLNPNCDNWYSGN